MQLPGAHNGLIAFPGNLDNAAQTCGSCHAAQVASVTDESWLAQETDWWRPVAADNDGVFALEFETFKRYFGWISAAR